MHCCHFWWHWHHLMLTPVPMLHLILIILTQQMQYCHWWSHWHHMMVMLVPVAWHAKKSCSSPFNHLNITDGMVPLMTLLASCDTNRSINGISWLKGLCYTSFWWSSLNKCSCSIDDTISITWCWYKRHHMTKKSCCMSFYHLDLTNEMVPLMMFWHHVTLTLASMELHGQKSYFMGFQLFWPNEYNGPIDSGFGITQCWCQCQQCQITYEVMFLLISNILN